MRWVAFGEESGKTMNPEIETNSAKKRTLVVDSLLAVPLEIPAGRIVEVGEQGPDTGHVDGVFVDEFDFVVLFRDGVVAVDRDGAERLPAFWDAKAQGEVVEAVDNDQANRDNDWDAPPQGHMAMMGKPAGEVKWGWKP